MDKVQSITSSIKITKRLDNPYKIKRHTKLMQKMKINSILAIFVALSFIGQGFCETEDVCRYIPGQTIFRCNDAMPNVVITPGQETNLTIYCCLTGDLYNNTDKYNLIFNKVPYESYSSQSSEGGLRVIHQNIDYYNSTKWISNYYVPETISGFNSFPVIITYSPPLFDSVYDGGLMLKSRLDLSVDIPGKMVLKYAIIPSVRLPIDYKPINYYAAVAFLSTATLAALILFILTFKNNRIYQNIKKSFKKKSKKISETKEEKSEKN